MPLDKRKLFRKEHKQLESLIQTTKVEALPDAATPVTPQTSTEKDGTQQSSAYHRNYKTFVAHLINTANNPPTPLNTNTQYIKSNRFSLQRNLSKAESAKEKEEAAYAHSDLEDIPSSQRNKRKRKTSRMPNSMMGTAINEEVNSIAPVSPLTGTSGNPSLPTKKPRRRRVWHGRRSKSADNIYSVQSTLKQEEDQLKKEVISYKTPFLKDAISSIFHSCCMDEEYQPGVRVTLSGVRVRVLKAEVAWGGSVPPTGLAKSVPLHEEDGDTHLKNDPVHFSQLPPSWTHTEPSNSLDPQIQAIKREAQNYMPGTPRSTATSTAVKAAKPASDTDVPVTHLSSPRLKPQFRLQNGRSGSLVTAGSLHGSLNPGERVPMQTLLKEPQSTASTATSSPVLERTTETPNEHEGEGSGGWFRIEIAYGPVTWVIHRRLRDFIRLHYTLLLRSLSTSSHSYTSLTRIPSPPSFPLVLNLALEKAKLIFTSTLPIGSLVKLPPRKQKALKDRRILFEKYLVDVVRLMRGRVCNEVCAFLEISASSFEGWPDQVAENPIRMTLSPTSKLYVQRKVNKVPMRNTTYVYWKGKEGLVKKRSGDKRWKSWAFCGAGVLYHTWSWTWLAVRDGYIAVFEDVSASAAKEVFLWDASTLVLKQNHLTSNPTLQIQTQAKTVHLSFDHIRQLNDFEIALQYLEKSCLYTNMGPFESTFHPRIGRAKFLVDGCHYMRGIRAGIENARNTIYIMDWWLTPDLYLERPANEASRIDVLLKKKAEDGVMIYIIVYKEVSVALTIDSSWTKDCLSGLHHNIRVLRSPDHAPGGIMFWAHHEKMVLIDHNYLFMGGLDLCLGRWDTSDHPLTDYHPSDPTFEPLFPGQDYSNPRIADFRDVAKSRLSPILDTTQSARMPWHDVGMLVMGPVAIDAGRHFVERWNHIKREKANTKEDIPFLMPKPVPNTPLLDWPTWVDPHASGTNLSGGNVEMQLLRSCAKWSTGTPIEHSIQNAYIELIREAKHFVYIENQFFVSNASQDEPAADAHAKNGVAAAIGARIIRAHKEKTKFRVYIVLPLIPAFESEIDSADASTVRMVMLCQYLSLSRGPNCLYDLLEREGIVPSEYISVCGLRRWERLEGDDGQVGGKTGPENNSSISKNEWDQPLDENLREGLQGSDIGVGRGNTKGTETSQTSPSALSNSESLGVARALAESVKRSKRERQDTLAKEDGSCSALNDVGAVESHFERLAAGFTESSDSLNSSPFFGQHIMDELNERPLSTASEPAVPAKNRYSTVDPSQRPSSTAVAEGISTEQTVFEAKEASDRMRKEKRKSRRKSTIRAKYEVEIPKGGTLVTEEVYVHSKILIVDDMYGICGSGKDLISSSSIHVIYTHFRTANVNDRSMLGFRDSEMAIIMHDHDTVWSKADGVDIEVSATIHDLRVRLFREHLGKDQEGEEALVQDIVSDFFWNEIWNKTAKTNTGAYREVFRCVPEDSVHTWSSLKSFLDTPFRPAPGHLGLPLTSAESLALIEESLSEAVCGNLVVFPLNFLKYDDLSAGMFRPESLLPMEVFA